MVFEEHKRLPDHLAESTSDLVNPHLASPITDLRSNTYTWAQRRLEQTVTMMNLFNLKGLPKKLGLNGQDKVVLSAVELESFRSEIAALEEREAHYKAQLEHIDEILRSASLSGYLFLRTRWAALPGEPPIDDTEVDDWLPRFVVLQGSGIYIYMVATDLSPLDTTLLPDVVEVGPLPCLARENEETRFCFYILTSHGLRYECSSTSEIQVDSWLAVLKKQCKLSSDSEDNSSQICRSARSFLSAASKQSSRSFSTGRSAVAAAAVSCRGRVSSLASIGASESGNAYSGWISSALILPAAAFMLQEQEAHAAQLERTFIAIKPDGVQRGLISEILSRFERKGYKLVAIKVVVPSKDFAKKHYHDLKERPFFDGLCDFLSSGPVVAMVWEGEGVIKYGRKLIGATDPQKSEPGTIRGDLAVVVGRNIIHGSDGPETAKDEINLWFKPEELVSYTSNGEKWIYGIN
ncbi:uncharacterized protein LOC127255444 [Andrographis paniculata]|uniref:uncharacterized protein LOC127255444 n=1 Tax=Andrographis paniculata TaxID=175694 RepID=UPI0021E96DC7|nr:uncharacterized protein LOC127255444 [Andrographis paniculata]